MAIDKGPDLSVAEGRFSRSARGRVGGIDLGDNQVSSRDVGRNFDRGDPSADGGGFGALARGVQDFMPIAAKIDADNLKKEDDMLKRHAEILQATRPKDVQEAIKTGDYSKLPQALSGQEKRASFVDTLKGLTGQSQAEDWAQDPEVVSKITEADDPAQARADLLKAETKGMDSIQAQHFIARATEQTDQNVAQTRLKNVLVTQDAAFTKARTIALSDIASGNMVTAEDYETAATKFAQIGSVTGAKSEMDARQAFDAMILEQAYVYGNQRAMFLAHTALPSRDGQSLSELYPDKVKELDQQRISRIGDPQNEAHATAIFELQTKLSRGEIGPEQGLKEITNLEDMYAPTSTTNSMRDTLNGKLATQYMSRNLLGSYLTGKDVNLSDMRKAQAEIVQNWGPLMAEQGITDPAQQAAKLSNFLSEYEPDGDTQNYLGRKLASDNPAEAAWAFTVVKGMDPYKRKTALSSANYDMYVAMETSAHFGKPIDEARDRFLSAEKSDISETRQLEERFQLDTKHKNETIKGSVASAVDYAKQHGLDTGDTPFWPGDTPDQSSAIASEFQRAMNHYLYMGYAKTLPEAQQMAAVALAPRLSVDLVNGQKTLVLRSEEDYTVDNKGQTKTYRPSGSADLDQAVTDLSAPGMGFNKPAGKEPPVGVAARGVKIEAPKAEDKNLDITGLRDDRLTAYGYGKAVDIDSPEGPTEMVLPAGDKQELSPERAKTEAFKNMPVVETLDNGNVVVQVPTENTKVGETGAWINDNGVMRFRYIGKEYDADDQAAKLNAMSGQTPRMGGKRPPLRGIVAPAPGQPAVPEAQGPASGATGDWLKNVIQKLTPSRVDATGRTELSTKHPATLDEAQTMVKEATKASDGRAEFLLDYSSEGGIKFSEASLDFIQEHEGYVPYVYDDATGKQLQSGQKAKGYATVGIGYNLSNASAREDLKAVGADYDSLVAGKSTLSITQARALASVHMKKVTRWLYKHFDGHRESIPMNQWIAMTSLAYNSRWNENGPTLIGPKLTKAVMSGDTEAAAEQISLHSMGGILPNQANGIKIRRNKEAMMFRGNWKRS